MNNNAPNTGAPTPMVKVMSSCWELESKQYCGRVKCKYLHCIPGTDDGSGNFIEVDKNNGSESQVRR